MLVNSHHICVNGNAQLVVFTFITPCLFRCIVTRVLAPSWVCAAQSKPQIHKELIPVSFAWVRTAQLQQS